MHRGYVKLWRKSLESGLLQNADAWQLMTWCLLRATHKPMKQVVGKQIVMLEPGQMIFGRKKAALDLRSSEQKIRTSLKLLEKADFLTIKSTNKFSVITIVNWGTYQPEQPTNNQHPNQPATSKQPTINHKQEQEEQKAQEETLPDESGTKPSLKETLIEKYGLPTVDFVYVFNEYVRTHDGKQAPRLTDKSVASSCDVIDKLIRIDKHTLEGIKEAMRWARTDDFWSQQVKSLGQLRKSKPGEQNKIQKIMTKMGSQGSGHIQTLKPWEDPTHPDYWKSR